MVEELHIRPDQLGLLESIREVPGLLTVLIGALVMTVAEQPWSCCAFARRDWILELFPRPDDRGARGLFIDR